MVENFRQSGFLFGSAMIAEGSCTLWPVRLTFVFHQLFFGIH
ncbi:hypothetical protein NST02_21135 [Robertmurraya sp. FSL W8-0741]